MILCRATLTATLGPRQPTDCRLDTPVAQCTEDVFWNCATEACVLVLTRAIRINSIKRKKKHRLCYWAAQDSSSL